jgi:hypothetical protein
MDLPLVVLVAVLAFCAILAIPYYSAFLPWVFRRFLLPGMLRKNGWADRTETPEFTRSELRYMRRVQGEAVWQDELRITGAFRGRDFAAVQRQGYDNPTASEGRLYRAHTAMLEVSAAGVPGGRTISIGLLTGKIKIGNGPLTLPPEFEQWLKKNRFRCRTFGTRRGFLTAGLRRRIYRAKLLRRLNFLVDVADQWPGTKPRKAPRSRRAPGGDR